MTIAKRGDRNREASLTGGLRMKATHPSSIRCIGPNQDEGALKATARLRLIYAHFCKKYRFAQRFLDDLLFCYKKNSDICSRKWKIGDSRA